MRTIPTTFVGRDVFIRFKPNAVAILVYIGDS